MSLEKDLLLKQVDYLNEAKKLYLDDLQRTERVFFVVTGALMAFLCTDAVASVNSTLYPYLWFIPCLVCLYAIAKINSIKGSLVDIADFEIKNVEPLLGDDAPKWETHLKSQKTLRGRAKDKWSIEHRFWFFLLIANLAIASAQIAYGPIFQKTPQNQQPNQPTAPDRNIQQKG